MIITTSGRPVDGSRSSSSERGGKWLNFLARVDVSDVGNLAVAEAFYDPW